jgi:hypothetical protein
VKRRIRRLITSVTAFPRPVAALDKDRHLLLHSGIDLSMPFTKACHRQISRLSSFAATDRVCYDAGADSPGLTALFLILLSLFLFDLGAVRMGRPHLHPYIGAHSRPRASLSHQSLWHDVRGDHGDESGEDRSERGGFAEGLAHLDRALALYDPAAHRPLATRFGQDMGVAILSFRPFALSISWVKTKMVGSSMSAESRMAGRA